MIKTHVTRMMILPSSIRLERFEGDDQTERERNKLVTQKRVTSNRYEADSLIFQLESFILNSYLPK
jgi:hypothetical protein